MPEVKLTRLFRESIKERLEKIEKRASRNKAIIGCVVSKREFNILKEDIEEIYAPNSRQMRRLKKLEKRVCE